MGVRQRQTDGQRAPRSREQGVVWLGESSVGKGEEGRSGCSCQPPRGLPPGGSFRGLPAKDRAAGLRLGLWHRSQTGPEGPWPVLVTLLRIQRFFLVRSCPRSFWWVGAMMLRLQRHSCSPKLGIRPMGTHRQRTSQNSLRQ